MCLSNHHPLKSNVIRKVYHKWNNISLLCLVLASDNFYLYEKYLDSLLFIYLHFLHIKHIVDCRQSTNQEPNVSSKTLQDQQTDMRSRIKNGRFQKY